MGFIADDANITGLEWLAFEPEHSEVFSISWRASEEKRDIFDPEQAVLRVQGDEWDQQSESWMAGGKQPPPIRGYLRTYQASRDLNLLYFDGMSAAKGCLGTLDTQDLVLRLINGTTSPCDHRFVDALVHDLPRVAEICEMITPWGYDGLLRMEAGFEIVYCDFNDGGLDLLSQLRQPFWDMMKAWNNLPRTAFHMSRAASQHYDDMIETGRLQLDFSRMVSAYFYPINFTSPDADTDSHASAGRDLPRLGSTTQHERQSIQRRVQEVAVSSINGSGINWQAIVDAIVSRYADRLAFLAQLSPALQVSDAERFAAEVFVATNTYVDYPATPDDISLLKAVDSKEAAAAAAAAQARCQNHYLQQVEPNKSSFTSEDHLIYAAVTQVTGHICETLFQARSRIEEAYGNSEEIRNKKTRSSVLLCRAAEVGHQSLQKLVSSLQWSRWEKCDTCAVDEFCFYPMFPYGSIEDAKKPRCLDEGGISLGLNLSNNYWQIDVQGVWKNITEPF
ncbi:hypothetical protein N0V82_010324 [Gnomoniopsis sp. IMI 355080]|nr:hypothetical protein N0V82_010324 [Gnomoniopsis sp. IMI 355080]